MHFQPLIILQFIKAYRLSFGALKQLPPQNYKQLWEAVGAKKRERHLRSGHSYLFNHCIYIRPNRFLKVNPFNTRYNLKKKFRAECTSAEWDDKSKIEKAMAVNINKDNNEKDLQKKSNKKKKSNTWSK